MKYIGREIKAIIEKKGLSFYQVAKDLGVRWEGLYRYLGDRGNPRWKTIKILLDYLGYDVFLKPKQKEVKKARPKRSGSKKRR